MFDFQARPAKSSGAGKPDFSQTGRKSYSAEAKPKSSSTFVDHETILAATEETAQMGSWHVDPETGALHWTAGMYRILDVSPDTDPDKLCSAFSSVVHPEDLHLVCDMDTLETALVASDTHCRIVRGDGTVRWLSVGSHERKVASGQTRVRMGYIQDITASKHAAEQAAQAAALGDDARDTLLSVSSDGVILNCNRAAVDMYGYPKNELVGKSVADLRAREMSVSATGHSLDSGAAALIQATHVRKDGSSIDVEISASTSTGKPFVVSAVRDVTERVREHRAHRRTAHVLAAISACNEAVLRSTSPSGLHKAICEIMVDSGPYQLVWCGLTNEQDTFVTPVATAGRDSGYPYEIRLSWDESHPGGNGPLGISVRTGQPVVFRDVTTNPQFLFRELAKKRGWASVAAIPLMRDGKALGAIALYSLDHDAFEGDELELLVTLASNAAYGLSMLETADSLQTSESHRSELVLAIIEAMGKVVDSRDHMTQGHQTRVAEISVKIATELGLSAHDREAVRLASLVHDLGKVHIPSAVLSKPGPLDPRERELMRAHVKVGRDILKDISFPWPLADIVWQHHERLDGSGYPRGLRGSEISLLARVVAVADVLEATTADRVYHAACSMRDALSEVQEHREEFDVDVVQACVRLFDRGQL